MDNPDHCHDGPIVDDKLISGSGPGRSMVCLDSDPNY